MIEHLIDLGCILLIAPIAIVIKTVNDVDQLEDDCVIVMTIQAIAAFAIILVGIGVSLKG